MYNLCHWRLLLQTPTRYAANPPFRRHEHNAQFGEPAVAHLGMAELLLCDPEQDVRPPQPCPTSRTSQAGLQWLMNQRFSLTDVTSGIGASEAGDL
jgi:hypothetical protein